MTGFNVRRLAVRVGIFAFVRLCLVAGVATAASPEADGPGFTMTTFGGIESGTAKELVYDGSVTESELDWNFSPFYLYGLRLDYGARSGFFASLCLSSGIPGKTGTMTDSDWLNYEHGDYNKTDYSVSDCVTEQALFAEASAGWMWELQRHFDVGLYVSFQYVDLEWAARDGYYQYASDGSDWSSSLAEERLYGLGILYRQSYVIPKIGLRASCRPSARLSIEGSISFSPAVSCTDEDDHAYRSITFTDSFRGGTLFEPELAANYVVSPRSAIGLRISYRNIRGLRGDEKLTLTQDYTVTNSDGSTSTYPAGYSETYSDGAGAALESFELSLSLSIHL